MVWEEVDGKSARARAREIQTRESETVKQAADRQTVKNEADADTDTEEEEEEEEEKQREKRNELLACTGSIVPKR